MSEITIPAEAVALSNEAETMLSVAQGFLIRNQDEYGGAVIQLKAVKAKAKELEESRVSMTKPLDTSKKTIMDFFRKPLQFLTDAETSIKRAMLTFDNEQARIRREQEAKAQEAARKEQDRLDKLAEKKAEKAEAKGNTEKAEEIRASVPVVPVPIMAAAPKVQGISTRTTWGGKVTDKMALIKAVAAGQAPASLLDVNMPALNQMARALKGEMNFPGVEAVATQQIAA